MILKAKTDFLRTKIADSNSKDLFKTVNTLLNKAKKVLPVYDSADDMCLKFADFFTSKIEIIRSDLDNVDISSLVGNTRFDEGQVVHRFLQFDLASVEEVEKVMRRLPSKSCSLDPIPTWLLKQNMCTISPFITRIVNSALQNGVFPDCLKKAIVIPVLKKQNLDANILKNYRPVSNIHFLSKVIETIVASRLKDYITIHKLHDPFQSAYRSSHSTETALLKVKSDILNMMDNNCCVMLVMLDLTAAFDTIDHRILINRLHNSFVISWFLFEWFNSYMPNRCNRISCKWLFFM